MMVLVRWGRVAKEAGMRYLRIGDLGIKAEFAFNLNTREFIMTLVVGVGPLSFLTSSGHHPPIAAPPVNDENGYIL